MPQKQEGSRKNWLRPVLTVLVRADDASCVLLGCKSNTSTGPDGNYCYAKCDCTNSSTPGMPCFKACQVTGIGCACDMLLRFCRASGAS